MKKSFFITHLLYWYELNKRDLPWRNVSEPYHIWLSEILLQQTRVQQGLPYYYRFIEKYPNVHELAAADEKEVLRLWQGLGYYSRARNLLATARYIQKELGGTFPNSYNGLIKLKGVGTYTAAAIASFAYLEKVAVVDGNVYRVLARVFGIATDISSGAGAKEFALLAHQLLPEQNHSTYNQAIMEFGALHCTPALPKCNQCPMDAICIAKKNGLQLVLPVKFKKLKKKIRYFNYLVFIYEDACLLKVRQMGDVWTGLYEFHLEESDLLLSSYEIIDKLKRIDEKITIQKISKDYKHLLTHQTIFARFSIAQVGSLEVFKKISGIFDLNIYTIHEIQQLPKPMLIIKFLEDNLFS